MISADYKSVSVMTAVTRPPYFWPLTSPDPFPSLPRFPTLSLLLPLLTSPSASFVNSPLASPSPYLLAPRRFLFFSSSTSPLGLDYFSFVHFLLPLQPQRTSKQDDRSPLPFYSHHRASPHRHRSPPAAPPPSRTLLEPAASLGLPTFGFLPLTRQTRHPPRPRHHVLDLLFSARSAPADPLNKRAQGRRH